PPKARQDAPRAEQRSTPRLNKTAGPANVPAQNVAVAADVTPAPAAAPSAPVATVAETPRPAAPAVSAQAQSDMLAAYRQRLTELFARGYEYPRVAAMRGWEGEVRLRLKVARKGNLLGVALDRSSGFDVLDQHALSMLEGHGSLPPLPDALEGNEIQVIVPINYKLRKTT
ncbi:MAG TPA: TonB family protein, partial [Azonexus sp.]|nr:TonB family protein [Azonexus sp.]